MKFSNTHDCYHFKYDLWDAYSVCQEFPCPVPPFSPPLGQAITPTLHVHTEVEVARPGFSQAFDPSDHVD